MQTKNRLTLFLMVCLILAGTLHDTPAGQRVGVLKPGIKYFGKSYN